jgi:predicted N-acetyltransferase YhbS
MIRTSVAADRPAIREIHRDAFGQAEGQEIADLVDDLFDDETARPLLSLVAEVGGRLVGHVLYTRAALQPEDRSIAARILTPAGVRSDVQGEGVGGALIRDGLQQLMAAGVDLVFVLGHPGYYPRFGFRPAGALGFEATHPVPAAHADAWMVLELSPRAIDRAEGKVCCSEVLSEPRHWRE